MAANAQMEAAIASQMMRAAQAVEEQVDQEIERLETMDDEEMEKIRVRRLDQMKRAHKQRDELQTAGHGEYTEITNEKEFFEICKKSKRVVCHFYREGTFRCKILDKHLRILAAKHIETRFITGSVDRLKFLVDRLNVRVLPTMALIDDGQTQEYIRGFDGISDEDDFKTELLERRLATAGIINGGQAKETKGGQKTTIVRGKKAGVRDGMTYDSDSDGDW